MPTPSAPRAIRSDARRNRERVLASAERVFAERGLDATLEEVAGAAGVGIGTIYRGFGSKEALQEAVFERRIELGVEMLADCMRRPTAGEGLSDYLRQSVLLQADDRGLHEFVYTLGGERGRFDRLRERIEPLLAALVERAKAEGSLRADFQATDLPPLILMFSRLAHTDRVLGPRLARRYLELFLAGLSPEAAGADVEPALTDQALGDWLTGLGRRTSEP